LGSCVTTSATPTRIRRSQTADHHKPPTITNRRPLQTADHYKPPTITNEAIEIEIGLGHDQVGRWRKRWRDNWMRLIGIECVEGLHELEIAIKELLAHAHRSGGPPRISSEQQASLIAKACEDPQDSDRPIACWTCSVSI
jgi:hypothetical protein